MDLLNITPILNVSNLMESIAWFEKLGWRKCWTWGDPPDFGAVGSGECEIFLCQGAQGSRGGPMPKHVGDDDTGGVWMSWWVKTPADVDAAHAPSPGARLDRDLAADQRAVGRSRVPHSPPGWAHVPGEFGDLQGMRIQRAEHLDQSLLDLLVERLGPQINLPQRLGEGRVLERRHRPCRRS